MNNIDTIISIATPMGTGALSVIRCSGTRVSEIIDTFFKKKLPARQACYLNFKSEERVVDDVIAVYYVAPKSYTGEEMLEIMCHGGPVIYQLIIKEILKLNDCRIAKAGEFTERAFLNNKMSLTEAESICALINAKTEAAALAARESLSGKMTKDLFQIDNVILKTRVQVEALLDFSDEDIETEGIKEISSHIEDCKKEILRILEKLETNKLLFETSKVAVIGKPNTGKSSLTNYLTDEEVSIVNTKAGTTRDVVSKMFSLNGAPVTILDTAGIRETTDLIEKEGKEKALKQAALANITLFLYDARVGIDQEDLEILNNVKQASSNILVIANKIDLIEKDKLDNIIKNDPGILCISIKENINMDILKVKILDCLKLSVRNSSPGVYNIKNIEHLNKAYQEINDIQVNLNELEVIAERLKNSQKHISAVLDNDDEERVLSGIFSNFCIGK